MLTNIRARNFKSLKDVTLDLGPRNVLVGANMAGKSNAIDLFRFIYDMTFPRQPGSGALSNAVFARGGFGELLWKGGNEQLIEIALSGTTVDQTRQLPWEYSISIQGEAYGNFRVVNELLRVRRHKDLPMEDLIETTGSERFFRNTQNQRIGGSLPDPTRSMLEIEFPGSPGSFLRSSIAKWRFYELIPSLMRHPNQPGKVQYLQEHGENLSQWLLNLAEHYDESFARILHVLRDALPQVTGLFNSPTQQSTVVLGSREKHLTRPVTLSQMSAGELAFIAFLSLIYAPPDRPVSLYCIEDLENYLHPSLIVTLLQVLRQTQEAWEGEDDAPQIIMTTHSPLVVDKMKLDEIIVVEKREGATTCIRPGDKPRLRKLLEDEEIGLGDLVYTGALSDVSK
jgi:predicted ATPase